MGSTISRCTLIPSSRLPRAGADRSKLPDSGTPPDTKFPELERATLSNGLKIVLARRSGHPPGALRPAARCRVCGGPVRHSRHRQSGHGHAGRGHHAPHLASDQRSAGAARRQSGHRLQARCLQRVARGAEGEPGRVARHLRRRHSASHLPPPRLRAAQEAAAGSDPAGKGRSGRPGAAGIPRTALWTGARLRQSVDRLGNRGVHRQDHAG